MSDFLSKKNLKKIIVIATILLISLTITGCVSTSSNGSVPPLSNNSGSFWDRYILYYISSFILWLATILHNAYGWSIVVFTIIVRVVLLPLNAISIKSMAKQQSLQPEMEALRKKYSDRDAETRRKLQEETSKLYKESGVNPYLGCLPMLIQMPIMIALWQAILRTPELQNGRFLWMDLGHPDPYMAVSYTQS
ncbi:YidC/Oxa1 family membrane protein insertase, partial [Lactobacillus iners]|uniref:YidC/Oxa1 family membrane protein insertase n=1 Tax=Lactobacillus iners TaxID=147802 RepID=UPI0011AF4832